MPTSSGLLYRHYIATCVEINQCVGCSLKRLGTDISTPSSRRRFDGVEVDAMIQHERAVKFDFHTDSNVLCATSDL